MNKQNALTKIIYAIVFVAMMPFTPVQAEGGMGWILSGSSPSLDRSTKFLSNGYNDAGIRFANKVVSRTDKTLLEEIIVRHNLCIGYSREGRTDKAAPHCEMVKKLPMPQVALKQIRQGLYKVKKRGKDTELFGSLITQNLTTLDSKHIAQNPQSTEAAQTN